MRKHILSFVIACFVLSIQMAFSQAYKVGDKCEALIQNNWRTVKILAVTAGKSTTYEVAVIGVADKKGLTQTNFQVSTNQMRLAKQTTVSAASSSKATVEIPKSKEHLGRFDLYSGIPTLYIGHCIILGNGKYKVALVSDESNYESGDYIFNNETNSYDWETGLFHRNNWKGKLISKGGNSFRIEFNKATFAETN